MRKLSWMVAGAALASASAQDWARERLDKSSRHQEWVYLKHGDRTVDTFVVYPEVSNKTPVILVIHDDQGLTEWAQSMADALAEAGYIAVAPDLLSGMGPKGGGTGEFGPGNAAQAFAKLPPDQVKADIRVALDYAKRIPAANGKIALAGFGWGWPELLRFGPLREGLAAIYLFNDTSKPFVNIDFTSEAKPTKPPIFMFDGPGSFMRLGDAPGALSPLKEARDNAWEQWKKLLAKL